MVEAIVRKFIIKINHVWFIRQKENMRLLSNSDIYIFRGVNFEPSENEMRRELQDSLITDLSQNEDIIWEKISKTYRNEIRRCLNENREILVFKDGDILKNEYLIQMFKKTYDRMYESKGLDTRFNEKIFKIYATNRSLYVSIALKDGKPCVFHSYIIDKENARFWLSCSEFRDNKEISEEIGRLNKYLHWKDMINLKKQGILKYDWGGVSYENKDVEGIAKFKSKFGGTPIEYYNVVSSNNILIRLLFEKYFSKK